jgi:hypothetical protein
MDDSASRSIAQTVEQALHSFEAAERALDRGRPESMASGGSFMVILITTRLLDNHLHAARF